MTKGEVDARRPQTWAFRPFLPLTRGGGRGLFPEVGVLVEGKGATVYLTELYGDDKNRFRTCERVAYATLEDLFASGWRID